MPVNRWVIWNFIGRDVTRRGVVMTLTIGTFTGLGVAFAKALKPDHSIDWWLVGIIVIVTVIIHVLVKVAEALFVGNKIARQTHGNIWRLDRKSRTAGIITRINLAIQATRDGQPPDYQGLYKTIQELLDIMKIHVRDHLGNHAEDRIEVFGSLLLLNSGDLVVIARDSHMSTTAHRRETPCSYSRDSLFVNRAIVNKCPISAGTLEESHNESNWRTKSYKDVLAIPILSSDSETPLGVISFDSTRPYFFSGIRKNVTELDLYKGLQPYLSLLVFILEVLVSRSPEKQVECLEKYAPKKT